MRTMHTMHHYTMLLAIRVMRMYMITLLLIQHDYVLDKFSDISRGLVEL